MTKGIILISIGNNGYPMMAFNCAYSIKHHNSDLKICLITDSSYEKIHLEKRLVFDDLIPVKQEDIYTDGKLDPGRLKTRIHNYLPYDHNLYIDVDSLAVKDIEPAFDEMIADERYYITSEQGRGKIGEDIRYNIWADTKDIAEHFRLKLDQEVVAIQSSWAYFQKTKKAQKFYNEVEKQFDLFPKSKLKETWGGTMPDELIYSGVISKNNMNVAGDDSFMYFGGEQSFTYSDITDKHYMFSPYGYAKKTNTMWNLYDILLFKWTREHRDKADWLSTAHIYKSNIVRQYKHANTVKK